MKQRASAGRILSRTIPPRRPLEAHASTPRDHPISSPLQSPYRPNLMRLQVEDNSWTWTQHRSRLPKLAPPAPLRRRAIVRKVSPKPTSDTGIQRPKSSALSSSARAPRLRCNFPVPPTHDQVELQPSPPAGPEAPSTRSPTPVDGLCTTAPPPLPGGSSGPGYPSRFTPADRPSSRSTGALSRGTQVSRMGHGARSLDSESPASFPVLRARKIDPHPGSHPHTDRRFTLNQPNGPQRLLPGPSHFLPQQRAARLGNLQPQPLPQTPWPGQEPVCLRCAASTGPHIFQPFDHLASSDQHCARTAFRPHGHIEHPMNAVAQIDVRSPRRPPHGPIPPGSTKAGMARRVLGPAVGFDLRDPNANRPSLQLHAQQARRHHHARTFQQPDQARPSASPSMASSSETS